MFETVELFWEIYSELPREGPGDDESTLHVLASIPRIRTPRVLDIGCGPGMQTLCLARALDSNVTAVDNHQPFLDRLDRDAKSAGLDARITTINASMDALPFDDESFDIVWSEGAIYCMGFDAGLEAWRRLLAPNGVLVVSELTWLTENAPEEQLKRPATTSSQPRYCRSGLGLRTTTTRSNCASMSFSKNTNTRRRLAHPSQPPEKRFRCSESSAIRTDTCFTRWSVAKATLAPLAKRSG
jgi:cyclopropane fatty-acyl-phospholipid synthase-like methyltransferase